MTMDPRFYENWMIPSNDPDLPFMRTPFYEFAQQEQLSKEEAQTILEEIHVKLNMTEDLLGLTKKPAPTKESIAYTRYGDFQPETEPADHERSKHIL